MKTADFGAGARGRFKHRDFGRSAAVDHSHALAPFEARGNRGNRIVGNGDENQIGAVDNILRVGRRPATRNPRRQLFGRTHAAAGGSDDAVLAPGQTPGEGFGHASRADETNAALNLSLLLHKVHLSQ